MKFSWKQLYNNNGYALIYTFLILILVSVLGISLLTISSNSMKISANEREDQSIYYIAEGALNVETVKVYDTAQTIYNNMKNCPNGMKSDEEFIQNFHSNILKNLGFNEAYPDFFITDSSASFSEQQGYNPASKLTYSILSEDPLTINLISEGYFKEHENHSRLINKEILIKPGIIPDCNNDSNNGTYIDHTNSGLAAVLYEGLTLSGSSQVVGDALLGSAINFSNQNQNIITGKIDYLKSLDRSSILPTFPVEPFTQLSQLPYPEETVVYKDGQSKKLIENGNFNGGDWITNNQTYHVTSDTRLNNFTMNENNNIYLNLGNQDRNIYIENLNLNNGHIYIIGSGKLNLYVNNSFKNGSSSSINKDRSSGNVNIYYNGSSPVSFAGDQKINANLFIKEANYSSSGSSGITGNIFSGGPNISITGYSKNHQAIIAPFANVVMEGSAEITGSLIAKSLVGIGNIRVKFGNVSLADAPNTPQEDLSNEKIFFKEEFIIELPKN